MDKLTKILKNNLKMIEYIKSINIEINQMNIFKKSFINRVKPPCDYCTNKKNGEGCGLSCSKPYFKLFDVKDSII